jgi:hypothetical protein
VKSLTITTKGKGPDLSAVGATQKADFLNKYLMKQEKIKNKLHPTPFKGTPDDLKNLCAWLATLKK